MLLRKLLRNSPPASAIRDPHYRARFEEVPRLMHSWIARVRPLHDAGVLDFGCGEAVTALGVMLAYQPRRLVGVDIMPDIDRCLPLARRHLGICSLPGGMSLHRVAPGTLPEFDEKFDIAYSWSV